MTNRHANTTIPEAHGAARAWEVSGERRWRDIVEAYWECAVTRRGAFCTGGQTNGEIWTPPGKLSARLGDKTQEHCTVYNMMRLAEYLLRWTGDVAYADYWERNLINGILAQQHPQTGVVAYFLPLRAGSVKRWDSPTQDFRCCQGTVVQVHTMHANHIYYENDAGLVVSQRVPSALTWERDGVQVEVRLSADAQLGSAHRPHSEAFDLAVACERPCAFALALRLPWWLSGEPVITLNGERQDVVQTSLGAEPSTWFGIHRTWHDDIVHVELPKRLTCCPLPDAPDMVAFMDGPEVLAGLCEHGITLYGDLEHPQTMLTVDNEREWAAWLGGYRTVNQPRGLRFIPLRQVQDERYTVYFPVKGSSI